MSTSRLKDLSSVSRPQKRAFRSYARLANLIQFFAALILAGGVFAGGMLLIGSSSNYGSRVALPLALTYIFGGVILALVLALIGGAVDILIAIEANQRALMDALRRRRE